MEIASVTTIDDAARWLLDQLDADQREGFRRMSRDGLINLHFSVGMFVRNKLLYAPGSSCHALMTDAQQQGLRCWHEDDLSGLIILRAWERLQGENRAGGTGSAEPLDGD